MTRDSQTTTPTRAAALLVCMMFFLGEPSADAWSPPPPQQYRQSSPSIPTKDVAYAFSTTTTTTARRPPSHLYQTDPQNSPENRNDDEKNDKDFERKVRLHKVKTEIDQILNGPDAPFDTEAELQKVESISPGISDPVELHAEHVVEKLEAELYQAVEAQDFSKASQTKDEISKLHVDDCGAVLQVNAAFYKAFSHKSFAEMEQLWLPDAGVICIHPSHSPLVGVNAVLKSWKHMFESTNGSFQRNWMEPSKLKIFVKGTTAIITCDEDVYCRRFIRGKKRQTELVNKLTATNIFRKVQGRWYMIHHHASWHAESDAAKMALNSNTERRSNHKSSKPSHRSSPRSSLDEAGAFGSDGFLGDFGPLLGGGGEEDGAPPVKRVIVGNLSDILNGSLGDILGAAGADEEDGEEGAGKAIIHFRQMDEDDEDEDPDEDDDSDDEEDEGTGAVSIIKNWSKSQDHPEESSTKSPAASTGRGGSGTVPKDALRQNCISALRKLSNQGSISPKQKRVLLTDIITCSAKGEFSMVEVAYELLCGEGEDKDAAEEEFADQCRVFAQSLTDSSPSP